MKLALICAQSRVCTIKTVETASFQSWANFLRATRYTSKHRKSHHKTLDFFCWAVVEYFKIVTFLTITFSAKEVFIWYVTCNIRKFRQKWHFKNFKNCVKNIFHSNKAVVKSQRYIILSCQENTLLRVFRHRPLFFWRKIPQNAWSEWRGTDQTCIYKRV